MCGSLITLLIPAILIFSFAVDTQEDQSKDCAEGADDNVADCEEVVLASKGVGSAHNKMFCAIIWLDIELVIYSNLIESLFQSWLTIRW